MRKILFCAAAAGALFLVVSCASTPKADSTPPQQPKPETPPGQPVAGAPDAELSQAKALQQRIDALGLGTYAPDDYAAANKDLQAGQDSYGKDNAASKKSLQSAVTKYNAVLTKGGPLYLAKAQREAEASKKAADDLKASVAACTRRRCRKRPPTTSRTRAGISPSRGTLSMPWQRPPGRKWMLPSRRCGMRSRTGRPRRRRPGTRRRL